MKKALTLLTGLLLIVGFGGLLFAADKDKEPATKTPVAKCPVSGQKISKDASVDYQGGKLYFCCDGCAAKFKENTAKYQAKANLQLVVTGQAKQVGCPLSGGKLDPSTKTTVAGIDVCFCCPSCPEKVKKATPEQQVEMVFGKSFEKAFVVKPPKE